MSFLFLTAKIRKKDENTKGCGNFFNKYVVKTLVAVQCAMCLTLKNVESKTAFKDGQNRRINFVGITGACSEA